MEANDPNERQGGDAPRQSAEGEPVKATDQSEAAASQPDKDVGASGGEGVPPGQSGAATTAPSDQSRTDADGEGSSKAVTLGAVLLVLIVGGVLVSFAISKGGDDPAKGHKAAPARDAPPPASWKEGAQIEIEVTVLPEDKDNLACASSVEVAGRHCGFETATAPWSKPGEAGANDDKHELKPYATTGRERFLAAGLWSEPALTTSLPQKRFTVKCKYTIEGKVKGPNIRWGKAGPWRQMNNDWFAGVLSGCTIAGS